MTRPTGRDPNEIVEISPGPCSNGHPLTGDNVQVRGAAYSIAWICRTCGEGRHRHNDGRVWVTHEAPF